MNHHSRWIRRGWTNWAWFLLTWLHLSLLTGAGSGAIWGSSDAPRARGPLARGCAVFRYKTHIVSGPTIESFGAIFGAGPVRFLAAELVHFVLLSFSFAD